MYVCYKIKNKQKEWHPATKPLKKKKKKKKKKIYIYIYKMACALPSRLVILLSV
jgi:hypothetical protein